MLHFLLVLQLIEPSSFCLDTSLIASFSRENVICRLCALNLSSHFVLHLLVFAHLLIFSSESVLCSHSHFFSRYLLNSYPILNFIVLIDNISIIILLLDISLLRRSQFNSQS